MNVHKLIQNKSKIYPFVKIFTSLVFSVFRYFIKDTSDIGYLMVTNSLGLLS